MSKKKKALIVPEEIISLKEFNIRKTAWDEYYKKVENTKVYKLHLQIREEYKKKNKGLANNFKELLAENRKILLEEKYELIKPNFPDPILEQAHNKLGIDEYWKILVINAKNEGVEIIYKNEQSREAVDSVTLEF